MAEQPTGPFTGIIVGSNESNALRLLLKMAAVRQKIQTSTNHDDLFVASRELSAIVAEIDEFAHYVQSADSTGVTP